ncbi:D-2-hydroxyacid dehydrogenase [Streptomyces goshikiensis]|uniref:D-2-hydroxyacid dehydrogenase n=1 Tax=Streptomyces goshikiensis TaxID=1942 RepID=UPI001679D2FE|nr:D-2-hydroxyacid dehydrogenase [Streptomyces goshikiensis]GHD82328.1 hydroxyacid dehydrogenase [Streptomyces goshikiensis]
MIGPVVISLNSPHSFWSLGESHLARLRSEFPGLDVRAVADDELPGALADAEVYFGWRFEPHWLPQAPRLKWIATPAAGTDHLPVEEVTRCGTILTRSYGFHRQPMAEHAMGMILTFSRGLLLSSRLQRTRRWWKGELAAEFFDLAGATMLIVGCGSVGTHLAAMGRTFGMNVIGVRRTLPTGPRAGIDWVPATRWRHALPVADVVVNLLPATAETAHLFDASSFASFKAGSVFVNLGRGATVDHAALLAALDSGRLRGAGLDVTDPRPLPRRHPLRKHPRVLLTPKTGVFSHSYMDCAVRFFADNMHSYLAGLPLRGTAEAVHLIPTEGPS